MRNFQKLSKSEMKMVVGGTEKVCNPAYCIFTTPNGSTTGGECRLNEDRDCGCYYLDSWIVEPGCRNS
jgi:cephalosporin-C deacetylase-like acetyl esterase